MIHILKVCTVQNYIFINNNLSFQDIGVARGNYKIKENLRSCTLIGFSEFVLITHSLFLADIFIGDLSTITSYRCFFYNSWTVYRLKSTTRIVTIVTITDLLDAQEKDSFSHFEFHFFPFFSFFLVKNRFQAQIAQLRIRMFRVQVNKLSISVVELSARKKKKEKEEHSIRSSAVEWYTF